MARMLSLTRVAAVVVAVWLTHTAAPARTTAGEVAVMTRNLSIVKQEPARRRARRRAEEMASGVARARRAP